MKKIHLKWALAGLCLLALGACRKEVSSTASKTNAAAASSDLVITPAGLMPRANVHFIAPGFHLSVQNGRLQKLETHSGRMVEDFGQVTITPTPRHTDIVQGWIAYAWWSNTGTPISSFTTRWTVPSTPANQGSQTLFLFNGMQDGTTRSSYIIQPVLQWGPSAAGGGKFWAITNWYVSSRHAFFGTLEKVDPGTALEGVMQETAVNGASFNYNSSFSGYPSASALQVDNVPEAFWTAETLESYGVTDPGSMYPPDADIALTGIQILKGAANANISWTPAQAVPGSAQQAVVVSNSSPGGEVDIYFR